MTAVAEPETPEDYERVSEALFTLAHFVVGCVVHNVITSGVDSEGLWVHLATDDAGITDEALRLHSLLENRTARMMRNTWGSVDIRLDGVYEGHQISLNTYAREEKAEQLASHFPGLRSDFLPVDVALLHEYVRGEAA